MIRAEFPSQRVPHAYISVGVSLPEFRPAWTPVPVLIDTGTVRTCIHPRDALRALQLPLSALDPGNWTSSRVEDLYGVGGESRYLETPAMLEFLDETVFRSLSLTVRLAESRADNQRLPSLLGWDVLQHFSFNFDARAKTFELHWAD